MDYAKIDNLVTEDESESLYELQSEIIGASELSDNEKLVRLALLQTLSPVEDWQAGAEIIRKYASGICGNDLLIAAYIAVNAYERVRYANIEYFIELLIKACEHEDNKFRSVAEYLRARYLKESGASHEEIAELLISSITLCPKYSMHYVLLAEYKTLDEKYEQIEKALVNVKKVITAEDLWGMTESELIEPKSIMGEITGTEITESAHRHLNVELVEINRTERYDLFRAALDHCGTFLLELPDDDIGYHIFEEFDGDCISFLNEKNMELICESRRITRDIANMVLELSGKFRALEDTELWNVSSVRQNESWLEILKLADSVKKELMQTVDRTRYFDCFNRRVYSVYSPDKMSRIGYITEYIDHPTVTKSVAVGVKTHEDVIEPGLLTVFYKNGEEYSFECYTDNVFSGQYGINISEDGERIFVISDVKGLWCYDKYGKVIWKTRYTSAGPVYPHGDGSAAFITTTHMVLIDSKGKVVKKRALFDGVRCEMSNRTIAMLTSENVVAVVDLETIEPILKISLQKLNVYHFRELIEAEEFYVLRGTELVECDKLPNGRKRIREKEVIYLLDSCGNVIRKIDDGKWNWCSRAYIDRITNEVVLYAEFRHHTSDTYRIPIN